MARMTRVARAMPVAMMLAGGVAVAALLVAPAGPAAAGPGISWQLPLLTTSSWTYGDSLGYWVDRRLTGGPQFIATSSTPQTCKVATDAQGAPTGYLELVDVGDCRVTFHLDGNATRPAYDGVVTRTVVPRELTLACRDAERASDEPNPDLTPVFSNLAPWDPPSGFVVSLRPLSVISGAGRWPVVLRATSPVNPVTRAPRYVIGSVPCTLTVNPVLRVVGMPRGKAAGLTVDGRAVEGNRYVFPYGSTITYSVAPVLGGVAPIPPLTDIAPEAWFATASTGSATGDASVAYVKFDDLVSESPFIDFYKQQFMSYTFGQYGWLAARRYLTSGVDAVPEETRLTRLRIIVSDLQALIKNTVVLYLGRPDYDAVKASGDQLVDYLQLIRDSGGFTQ